MKKMTLGEATHYLKKWFPELRGYRIEGEDACPAEIELMNIADTSDEFKVSSKSTRMAKEMLEVLGLFPFPKWFMVTKKIKSGQVSPEEFVRVKLVEKMHEKLNMIAFGSV